ncbi:ORC-CDC6 family AAA ATPase [Kocuria rhizophila]|uniref:ORC-CDC6 family AAA ATPase n=1 Tax=Kocuria rhizophila TaxID=72000 RepID=UPI0011AFB960|nr:hypothetical protein [Kocuria rhizophila]MCT1956782.1 ATP-binding protein [Kocuria rhizophila]MCT2072752.1 ATP-binding protein [Kocuria rhizophila]
METEILLAALQEVEKRAERVDPADVVATYVGVDSLVNALTTRDNGIVFGRRGTGKTHALKYLAEIEKSKGRRVIYIDMEHDTGSTEGRYSDLSLTLSERATRLVVDILSIVHNQLVESSLSGELQIDISILDAMLEHFQEVLVTDTLEAEQQTTSANTAETTRGANLGVTPSNFSIGTSVSSTDMQSVEAGYKVKGSGTLRHRIHFGAVTRYMKQAIESDPARRFWILIDEWSGVPIDLQPFVAEMLRRLFFGIPKVTVRIGAIPHRSEWRIAGDRGSYIGAEIGAEIFPLLDLDEFVVFPARSREEQASRSLDFFRSLIARHISTALISMNEAPPQSDNEIISSLFTQTTALQELVRAAEGVPRDALNILGRAGLRAGKQKISVPHVREAAAQLYTTTKATQLNGVKNARIILDRIINDVISGRKARAFLLAQDQTQNALIQQLVDERILHIIKRGYSSKDDAGERFDVLQIDYGCYVHLLGTSAAPQSLFDKDSDDESDFAAVMGGVEVPEDDYRAIRRAILDLPAILRDLDLAN